jgi:stage II sporulation protein D
MRRRLAVLVSAAALLATVAPPAHAVEHRRAASIVVATTGNGHGKGLSQYGARNRAQAGQSARQILAFYYPGTAWGSTGGSIRVRITDDLAGNDTVVAARRGLKAHSLGARRTWTLPARREHKLVARWRITPQPGHRSAISYLPRGGRWKVWRRAAGDAELTAGGRPMSLFTPAGVRQYRGALRSASTGSGSARDTVNVVGVDTYVRGVISREVFASWKPAALQSQAVAARTYAVFERADVPAGRYYDLCDTPACQVYGGVAAETSTTDAAVAATAGRILTYGGAPAFTQFSASNGGYSVNGAFPYLVDEYDPFDHGVPGDPLTRTFTGEQVTRHWTGLGDLVSVRVTRRDGDGSHDGHVLEVTVTGTQRTQVTTGDAFARFLGLRSTMFEVTDQ